ncbi:glycosyltransferase [Rhizobium sp. TH2]|uniref:glycosyltransferase n=1 Tax=Rhizobium sp. TH2 TaxID=2775403 RepID=UPI002157E611|nr:glycosyltransferase [Rhizobium sp. TH2]UVC11661.1 glycosyltransferase [Rhizobium sp. TH2]
MNVSVLLPVKNGLPYLKEALSSILSQDAVELEVIAIDDWSTDGTLEYLEELAAIDNRVIVAGNPDSGLVSALNFGLSIASHEFVARMDADDVAQPMRLHRQAVYLSQNPEVAVVGGQVCHIDENGSKTLERTLPRSSTANKFWLDYMCPVVHPAAMMRKSAILKLGGYRAAFLAAEDYDLWLRVCDDGKIVNLPSYVLDYRIHSSSVTQRKIQQQIMSIVYALYCTEMRRRSGADPVLGRTKPIETADFDGLPVKWRDLLALLTLNYAVDCSPKASIGGLINDALRVLESRSQTGTLRAMALWVLSRAKRKTMDGASISWSRLLMAVLSSPQTLMASTALFFNRYRLMQQPADGILTLAP